MRVTDSGEQAVPLSWGFQLQNFRSIGIHIPLHWPARQDGHKMCCGEHKHHNIDPAVLTGREANGRNPRALLG
jgi:hypothetical protein